MSDTLDIRREGAVASVVMHRKGTNSFALDLSNDLQAAFEELGADPSVRVIVLASEHDKYFSVGADLTEMGGMDREAADAEERIVDFVRDMWAGFDAVERCPKPVIAAIKGHAMGAGCEIALCCDFRIMVEDGRARIGLTESSLGLLPGAGGTQRLPRLIGKARALPMIMLGKRLSAAEAAGVGLVDQAVSPEEFAGAVAGLAATLAKGATHALALIKEVVRQGYDRELPAGLELEARAFAKASLSEDAAIGIMSFLSKQEPEFKGK